MNISFRALLYSTLLAGGIAGQAVAYCSTDVEQQALNTRVFQSELMVAALACNQQQQYNDFVVRFEPVLVERGSNMRDYFSRYYGSRAEYMLNSFVTRIANDAAERGLETEEIEYCDNTQQQFEDILALTPVQVDMLMVKTDFDTYHGIEECDDQFVADARAE